jgi:hypothetical protein
MIQRGGSTIDDHVAELSTVYCRSKNFGYSVHTAYLSFLRKQESKNQAPSKLCPQTLTMLPLIPAA